MNVFRSLEARKEPVNYFRFVTHPRSFSQTIENIFYVAFLVRDGKARLSIGADGQPYLGTALPASVVPRSLASDRVFCGCVRA